MAGFDENSHFLSIWISQHLKATVKKLFGDGIGCSLALTTWVSSLAQGGGGKTRVTAPALDRSGAKCLWSSLAVKGEGEGK